MNKTIELYAEVNDENFDIQYIELTPKPGLSSLCGPTEAISAIAAVAGAITSVWDQFYGKEGNYYIYFKNNTTEPIDIQFYKKGLIYKNKFKKLITIQPTKGGYFEFTPRNGLLGRTHIKCLVKYQANKSVQFFAFGRDTPRERNLFEVELNGVYLRSDPEVSYEWIESQDDIDDDEDDTESLM